MMINPDNGLPAYTYAEQAQAFNVAYELRLLPEGDAAESLRDLLTSSDSLALTDLLQPLTSTRLADEYMRSLARCVLSAWVRERVMPRLLATPADGETLDELSTAIRIMSVL